jgi:hypothetical protein
MKIQLSSTLVLLLLSAFVIAKAKSGADVDEIRLGQD